MANAASTAEASAKQPRRLRYLRIAVSVFFGMLTVLLVVLWIRSYWRYDSAYGSLCRFHYVRVESKSGGVTLVALETRRWDFAKTQMSYQSSPVADVSHASLVVNGTAIPTTIGFRWLHAANMYAATIPYWSTTAMFALTALVARGRLRFSLRTLLIATTLVAVILGLALWQ